MGAGLPIAVGTALSFKLQGKPHGALTFFEDGATNIGTFHESLNSVPAAPARRGGSGRLLTAVPHDLQSDARPLLPAL